MEQIKKCNLTLENRKKIVLTGVKEVLTYNDEKISLITIEGNLDIKGSKLKINKLDVQNGDVIIDGNINSMIYNDKEVIKNKENFFNKLFR